MNTPALSIAGNPGTGVGNITIDIASTGITVRAVRVTSDPTCSANLFRPCANNSPSFEPCIVTQNFGCGGTVLHAGSFVEVIPETSPGAGDEVRARLIINDVSLVCSLGAFGSGPCASAAGNNWGVVVGYKLVYEGTNETSGGANDFTASYVSNSAEDDCPPGTYVYCEDGNVPSSGILASLNPTYATSLTVS